MPPRPPHAAGAAAAAERAGAACSAAAPPATPAWRRRSRQAHNRGNHCRNNLRGRALKAGQRTQRAARGKQRRQQGARRGAADAAAAALRLRAYRAPRAAATLFSFFLPPRLLASTPRRCRTSHFAKHFVTVLKLPLAVARGKLRQLFEEPQRACKSLQSLQSLQSLPGRRRRAVARHVTARTNRPCRAGCIFIFYLYAFTLYGKRCEQLELLSAAGTASRWPAPARPRRERAAAARSG